MAYTPEQYAATGQFILANLNNPDLIASFASSLGLSANDLLTAAQTVNPNLTLQNVTGYFQQTGTTYQPPVYTPEPVTSVVPVTAYDYGGVTSNAGALASVTQEPVIAAQRPIIETEAVTGVKPGGLASVTQKPVVSTPVVSGPSDNWMAGFAFDASKVPSNFDWQTYTNLYPDLVAAGIDTPTEAQRHYALHGATEGRQFAQETPNYDAVRQLYQDVLGRAADEGGLANWAKQFGSSISPEEEAAFRQAAASEIAARPKQDALSNVATTASTTQGATLTPTVTTAVDPRLSEVKTYWEQTTGDKTYAGLTDDQILKIVTDNPSNYKQLIGKAAADLNRNNAIKNAFLSIYDDPNKTGYQKAQEIKTLAANAKVSDAEVASALGFTGADGTTLLNTFLNQPDPTTRAFLNAFADVYNNKDLTDQQKVQQINQLASTSKVSRDQIATALGVNSANLNKYLDQDPTVISSLLATANDTSYKPEHYTYATDSDGMQYRVLSEQGIAAERARADAGRRLEALGYELFDPDGPEYGDEFGSRNTAPERWLSPQEAANVTGTKINNQLRNQAYVQNTDYLAPALNPLANQLRQSLDAVNSSGGMLKSDPAYFYNKIAEELTSKTGITNLDDIGYRKLEGHWIDAGGDPPVSYFIRSGSDQIELSDGEYYNKKTGQALPNGVLPNFKHGIRDNETGAYFTLGPDGKPKLTTYYAHEGEAWKDLIAPLAIITAPLTVGSSLAALGGAEVAASALASELAAADIALGGLGGSAGAASLTAGALPTVGSLTSTLTSALPTELVQAGQTLANTFNTVKPYLQAGNALYQASQGNIANALLSGLDAAGSFGVSGAKELGQALNAGLAASKGNYFPALNFALNQTGLSGELANTKIAGDFTIGDAVKGATFVQAASSGDPTQILNAAASLTGSQDLKVAAAANSFINTLNNPNATAFDIAMGASRVSDALNTASKQPPPTGALPTGGQSTVTGALGTDTATGAAGNDVIDEYNVTGGGGALITSGNPTEDQQIAIQQRQNAVNQALTDYVGPGNDLSREGFVSQLQSLGFTKDQAEGYAQQADQKINMNLVGADVMNRYSKIDPEFGTPQLDRDTAVQEMVAAGFTSDRANEILNGIDAQNAIKLENKLSIQSAYNNFTSGKGTEEQLRSALTSAGYTDAEINNLVTRGNAILEGKRLTSGEQAQERAANLPDIRAEIAGKSSFNEAYALAREKLGPGATFTWQGKDYVASSATERPDLTKTTTTTGTSTTASQSETATQDTTQAVQSGQSVQVTGPGGRTFTVKLPLSQQQVSDKNTQGMLYNRDAVLTEIGNNLSTLAKANSQAAIDYLKNNPNSPWTQSISTAYEAAGTTMRDLVGGGVLALGDKPLAFDIIKGGEDLIKFGQSIGTGPQDTANWEETTRLVQATTDPFAKIGIVAGRILDGNSGLKRQVELEMRQEMPGVFFGGGTVRGALIAGGLLDSGETGGSATIEGYQQAIDQGKPHEEALAAGRARGLAEGTTELAIQATLGKITDVALGRKVSVGGKAATRVGSETLEETLQEGLGSVAGDVATGQAADVNTALTKSVLGGYTGKGTSLTTAPVSTAQDISEISSSTPGSDPEAVSRSLGTIQTIYGDSKATQVVNTLSSSTDLAASGQTIANSLANVLGDDAAATISNNLVANFGLSSASDTLQSQGVTLNNLSTVVGKTDSGNDITLGDALGASITGNGQQVADSTVVGTKADGTNLTLGDLSTTIKTGTAGTTTGATTGVTTDATTNVATQTGVTGNVNADTSTTTDPNTGVTTNTAVDTNTGTTTTTTTNPNTNTTTQTTVNQNTGVNTQTTTTTDQTSTTTVDPNTNVTTNTTVNTNTNTTTNITVNTNTDEVVVKVTDSSTGEVLDTQIKTVDELTSSELEKLTITDPTTKTPVTKPPVATAPTTSRAASLAGAMALPGMLIGEETPRLRGEMLKSEGDTTIKNPLEAYMERVEEMNRVDPALMAVMAQRLGIQLPEQSQEIKFPTFTYGQETSIDDILGLQEPKKPEEALYAEGGYVEPLRAKPMNLQFMNRGGALPGGREDFKGGKHVAGDGDGQSDDIPAWLADGEFVFPADVVSALGNGSTKAGTDKLYKMMHEIRARARSTKVKDLPPPAHKSPLDYIKKGK